MAQIIPWWKVEEHYSTASKKATAKGTHPFSDHLALGALIIQQYQGTTDRETVLCRSRKIPKCSTSWGFLPLRNANPFTI